MAYASRLNIGQVRLQMSAFHITISRDGDGPIRYQPDAVEIAIPSETSRHFRLVASEGWSATVDPPGNWRVTPVAPNLDETASYSIVSVPDGAIVQSGTIQVDLDLRSSFDPARCALPLRNRAGSELARSIPARTSSSGP